MRAWRANPILLGLAQGAVIGAAVGLVVPGDFVLRVVTTAAVGLVIGMFVSLGRRGL